MGTIQHETAIAVAGYNHEQADEAFELAKEYARSFNDPFCNNFESLLVGPVKGVVNSYVTYLMVPDGSKEWWDTSDNCNDIRNKFIELMSAAGCEVAHVGFGELGSSLSVKDR